MKSISVETFRAMLKSQDVSLEDLAFKCPMCRTIQSGADFIAAGAGADMESVAKYLGFSCIGRVTGAKPYHKNVKPGDGCDWTLGGLFRLHDLEVVSEDGKKHPTFEPASPEEAQEHAKRRAERAA